MIAQAKLFLNDRRKEVVIFILFFLVSTISFALGYISANQSNRSAIVIQKVDTGK